MAPPPLRTAKRFARVALPPLAAALCACPPPPGIFVVDAAAVERAAVHAPPPGWKRIAVLPFAGDPAHRRPAEELVAVRLRRTTWLEVLGPWAVQLRSLAVPGGAIDPVAWSQSLLEGDPVEAAVPPAEAIALARSLAVDALVLGRIADGGAYADLTLVDGATGTRVGALRRAGRASAARRGVHSLAMSSTERALEDLVAILATAPGRVPAVALPRPRRAAPPSHTEEEQP